jgi:hypothetical protein
VRFLQVDLRASLDDAPGIPDPLPLMQTAQEYMKSTSSTVWIIGALFLLVVATLDTVPDPPAVNPGPALCKVLQLHDSALDSGPPRGHSGGTNDVFSAGFETADSFDPWCPVDVVILTGQAADSSPPASVA